MLRRPRIFISAVTSELKGVRNHTAEVLESLDIRVERQDIFGFDKGNLLGVLRRKIDRCDGVIQLVGQCFGAEPQESIPGFGHVSYTQYEALYAQQKNKPVWYILLDPNFQTGDHLPWEPEDRKERQQKYRQNLVAGRDLFHPVANHEVLESRLLRLREEFEDSGKSGRRWSSAVLLLLLLAVGLVGALLWMEVMRSRDGWTSDPFMAVRVSGPAAGTLLGNEAYELKLDLKNATSLKMFITRIQVVSQSRDFARKFGLSGDRVFTTDIEVDCLLEGGEVKTIPIYLNEVLPAEIAVDVFHSLSGVPSTFRLPLSARVLPMPAPRHLAQGRASGFSSMEAIRLGRERAVQWSPDAQLVSMSTADYDTVIDLESRLKYTVAKGWIDMFYSRQRNHNYLVIVSPGKIEGSEISAPTKEREVPRTDPEPPKLGFEQALEIADRANLLSADWKDVRLGVMDLCGKSRCVWFLPYCAPGDQPVAIDAISGQPVKVGADYLFTYYIATGSQVQWTRNTSRRERAAEMKSVSGFTVSGDARLSFDFGFGTTREFCEVAVVIKNVGETPATLVEAVGGFVTRNGKGTGTSIKLYGKQGEPGGKLLGPGEAETLTYQASANQRREMQLPDTEPLFFLLRILNKQEEVLDSFVADLPPISELARGSSDESNPRRALSFRHLPKEQK